jgi:hypothetical protein
MSVHNITINDELKYFLSEDDSLFVLFVKVKMILLLMKLFSIMYKAYGLSFIYNNVLRYGFKELPLVSYMQIVVLLISLQLAHHMINE